ncbi:glycosyltransferase [Paenibacillus spiritus]|uniref:Glycosyltransferase n=1 Tax=Paenibacillus spiritus TaxID=2496557 RepID=A0A5J5FZJ1_9BACL|nr:glycosyltransferase [Paenibacillus spiritus]KAA8999770.1 glycosyltransferase [Paenibacillus spiritus]
MKTIVPRPEISIIVPCYKVEDYLEKCVESILGQTFANFELILVDDGSPDNCPAICDAYAERDSRIKALHKPNGGLSDARNFGLDIAVGRYIAFIDSDDWIAPDMLEQLHRAVTEQNADIAVCCHYSEEDGRAERINTFGGDAVLGNVEAVTEIILDQRIKSYAWDKLFKRELFDGVRYPVGIDYEDILTVYQLFIKASRVALVDRPLYYYVKRGSSITGNSSVRKLRQKFYAVNERHNTLLKQYRNIISPSVWNASINIIVSEGMDLYNYLLREKLLPDQSSSAKEVEAFIRRNLGVIVSARNIDLRAKAFALLIATNKSFYHYMYSNFTFLRKTGK